MICILVSDDGENFKVINPDTKEVITDLYELNHLAIQTVGGRWLAGFHVGIPCDEPVQVEATDG